jgi:ABC-type Fe3+/spermidine/putrescine transport system ATPase subunit
VAEGAKTPEPFLRVDGLTVGYGDTPVLKDVSLEVAEGEFVSILGPSGCGKTTLLKTIAGFVPAGAGRIEMGGRDLVRVPPARRDLGFVFQNYALFPHLSVTDNVAYGLASRGVRKPERDERAREMLALVGLESLGARRPAELSGGQQQRVAIARALAVSPSVLLMDEPLSNLDAKLRLEMREELHNLQRRVGVTTLFVTHDQEEAMTISDRLILLNAGVVEQVGSPAALYHRPRTPFVADFLGGGNVVDGRAVHGDGGTTVLEAPDLTFPIPGKDLPEGPVTVVLRTDRVRVGTVEAGGLAGTVEQSAFLGSAWRYRVRLDGGRVVHASGPPRLDGAADEGERVALSWHPDDVIVVGSR